MFFLIIMTLVIVDACSRRNGAVETATPVNPIMPIEPISLVYAYNAKADLSLPINPGEQGTDNDPNKSHYLGQVMMYMYKPGQFPATGDATDKDGWVEIKTPTDYYIRYAFDGWQDDSGIKTDPTNQDKEDYDFLYIQSRDHSVHSTGYGTPLIFQNPDKYPTEIKRFFSINLFPMSIEQKYDYCSLENSEGIYPPSYNGGTVNMSIALTCPSRGSYIICQTNNFERSEFPIVEKNYFPPTHDTKRYSVLQSSLSAKKTDEDCKYSQLGIVDTQEIAHKQFGPLQFSDQNGTILTPDKFPQMDYPGYATKNKQRSS